MIVEDKLLLNNKNDCCEDCGSLNNTSLSDLDNSGFLINVCDDCATFVNLDNVSIKE